MRKLLNTLYVTTPETYLALDGENIVVLLGDEERFRLSLHTLESIAYFGYKGTSPALMGACAERGIQVPGQLAVMGYDDTADSAWFFPPLTTIRQDFPQLGHACVAWLMSAMAGDQPVSTVLPVSLVVRETTCSRNAPARHARTLAAQLQALAREIARLTPE